MKSLSDIRNKRVLYVGTKNSDYLRLTQEIRLLREQGNEVTGRRAGVFLSCSS